MVPLLSSAHFHAKDMIYLRGDYADRMYFLTRGIVFFFTFDGLEKFNQKDGKWRRQFMDRREYLEIEEAMLRAPVVLAALSSASAVTPIEKVVGLLKDLQAKVEKEGAKEAAQYDKYACFCKNQAEFKQNAISKSEEKIDVLKADISDLEASIKALNTEISDLGKDIKQLEKDIQKATDKRTKEHDEYLVKAKDLNDSIDACKEAIAALKDSKDAMQGNTKLNLAQLKAVAAKAAHTPEAMREALALVRTAKKDAEAVSGDKPAVSFQYQSNDIIATIQDLKQTFTSMKKDLDFKEFDLREASEKQILGYTNEKTFKEKAKQEKEILSEEKTEEKEASEDAKDNEEKDKKSDEEFVSALEKSCKQKAKDWDQRSKARSEEMTALAEATETLENGAMQQYSVNKKLTGLIEASPKDAVKKVQAPVATATPAVKKPEAKKAPSFLQVRSSKDSQAAAVKRMLKSLDESANRLKSPVLAAIAVKALLKEDHFTNVRALIKDLMAKLKADAKSEATQKNFCDAEMKKAIDNRDNAADNIEEQQGIIAKKSALAAAKADEIEDLSEQIANLNKELLEAEELRVNEKAENEASIVEAKAGAEAVKSALATLEGFYGFTQVSYKPPNSGRDGKTVDDVAPEAFSGEYKGLGDSAKGILGILEVIQSDFERTAKTTAKDEKEAAKEHEEFVKDSKDSIKEKSQKKTDAEKAKEGAEQAVVTAKDNLYDEKNLKVNAETELEKLSGMCVEGEETYAERVQKRQDEIAALKEAYTILDNWQN